VSLAAFMTYLDNNIVNVAIPTIQRSLTCRCPPEWVVSSYLLPWPVAAGRRQARRRVRAAQAFLAGLAVFTLSWLAAGLVQRGRAHRQPGHQGIGAALLMPATLAIIADRVHQRQGACMAIGIWAAVGALALATGPALAA
jgi:MFS family permease